MAPITVSVDVDRPPEDVFAYATDPTRFAQWQSSVTGGRMDGDGQTAVGSKCVTVRRIGWAEREATAQVTKFDPPHSWAVHGVDGPIRAAVDVSVQALDAGARSHLTISLQFAGHGIGKLLVPLVVERRARKEMPANLQRLKSRIETATRPD